MKRSIGLLAGVLVLGTGAAAAAYEGGAVSGGGSISGVVKLSGPAPEAKPPDINKDQEICGKSRPSEAFVEGPGHSLKNAVVRLTNVTKGKKLETATVTLDQKGCGFHPHIAVVAVGGKLDIRNSDPITHNVHTFSIENDPVNKAQPKSLPVVTTSFTAAETIKTQCDIHKWMNAWIVATDHPYVAVTDDKGQFKLTDVPPGSYKIEIWHELLGKVTQDVTVKSGADAAVTVELKKK